VIASESRPLAVSHALAVGLGAGWLALVYLTPAPPPSIALLRPEEMAAIEVQFDDPPPPPKQEAPPPEEAMAINKPEPTPVEKERERAAKEEAEIGDAFGGGNTNALVGDVTNALRGVEVAKGSQAGSGAGRKAVIGYGQGGVGARTPGKGFDAAAAAAASGIGKVNAAGGVARATIRVAAPQVVARPGERASRDMAQLGTFVRSRQAQLQFCYQEQGLLINPALAGSIGVEVSLAPSGTVAAARITDRTWSGAGVVEAEGCILSRIRGWTFPASAAAGNETYGFSFVFNK
jgi:hypothetical protein